MGFYDNLKGYIKASFPFLWVRTWEESKVIAEIKAIAEELQREIFIWKITDGWDDEKKSSIGNPKGIIKEILEKKELNDGKAIFVLLDFHPYLEKDNILTREFKDVSYILKATKRSIIIVSSVVKIPEELEKQIVLLEYALPSRDDLKERVEYVIESANTIIAEKGGGEDAKIKITDEVKEKMSYAGIGLTTEEMENTLSYIISREGKKGFEEKGIQMVQEEKIKSLKKSGVDYYATDEKMSDVGDLVNIKNWCKKRKSILSKEARDYGLPFPKGILIVGIAGTGKSLIGKAISNEFGMPLLKFTMADIVTGIYGESEGKTKRFFELAKAIAPVVIFADEFDKAFQGVESSGRSDSGTTARIIGMFLTFMQESTDPIIWVATANDIKGLPPHFLRKGRFDEIFWADLPGYKGRMEIISIHIRKRNRNPKDFDLKLLAGLSNNFVGAEIEQGIIQAMFEAFDRGKEVNTEFIADAYENIKPISIAMRNDLDHMRKRLDGIAVSANVVEEVKKEKSGRKIEL